MTTTNIRYKTLLTEINEELPIVATNDSTDEIADEEVEVVPRDRYNLSYIIFFILGTAMLYPWNTVINANAYFSRKFLGSEYSATFANWHSAGFMISNVLVLAFMLCIGPPKHASATGVFSGGQFGRIFWALIVNAVVFVGSIVMTRLPNMDPYVSFYLSMTSVIICGSSTAYLQNGVFGLSSLFPPIFTQAVMSGQGLAGAAVSISQIVALLLSPPSRHVSSSDMTLAEVEMSETDRSKDSDVYDSAFLYFCFSFAVILVALLGIVSLRIRPLFHYYTRSRTTIAAISDADESLLLTQHADGINADLLKLEDSPPDRWTIFLQLQPYIINVFLTFMISLTVFPSIIGLIESVDSTDNSASTDHKDIDFTRSVFFVPLAFLVFALGDWLGKTMPGFPSLPIPAFISRTYNTDWHRWNYGMIKSPIVLTFCSIARLLFIPLFLICNVTVHDSLTFLPLKRSSFPPFLINSDAIYLIAVALFAITNGWFSSLAMMLAPARVSEGGARGKAMAGSMMVFSLTLGLAVGSGLSFVVRSFFGSVT